jgi:hypothetical protein
MDVPGKTYRGLGIFREDQTMCGPGLRVYSLEGKTKKAEVLAIATELAECTD